jgi:hypothetical protein
MSRWLHYGLFWLALCGGAACAGTETGNPDPSTPQDGGSHTADSGVIHPGQDAGSASDAGSPLDAGGADTGADADGGAQDTDAGG